MEQARILNDNTWIDGKYIETLCLSSGAWSIRETKFIGRSSILTRALTSEISDLVSLKHLDLGGSPMREVIRDVHTVLPLQQLNTIRLSISSNEEVQISDVLKKDLTRKSK